MSHQERIGKLQEKLRESAYDALFIDHLVDLFYLTGLELSLGRLFLTEEEAFLFVDARYFEACKAASPIPVLLSHDDAFFEKLFSLKGSVKSLAFDSQSMTYAAVQAMKKKLEESESSIRLEAWPSPLKSLRLVKDESEITALKNAANLGSKGFDYACSLLKEGISEKEIAIELEIFWKKAGAKGPAFDCNISFGANSALPHHRAGADRLKRGQIVLMDIGVNWEHYQSDMTRVLFFGVPEKELLKIYEIVREAQEKAVKACRAGIGTRALDAVAREHIETKGYGEFFSHSLGHGIGLEVHEAPTLRQSQEGQEFFLEEGMLVTIEPGIYLPELGGVRIEDTVLVRKEDCEDLTRRPKDLVLLT